MLVLTRKLNEEIIIGDTIRVRVVSIEAGRVKIGIDAPRDVPVDRAEVRAEQRVHGRRRELVRLHQPRDAA